MNWYPTALSVSILSPRIDNPHLSSNNSYHWQNGMDHPKKLKNVYDEYDKNQYVKQ